MAQRYWRNFLTLPKTCCMATKACLFCYCPFSLFGIGIGSLLCEKLSNHKVELGLVMFGAVGLTLFGIDLYASGTSIHAASGASHINSNLRHFLKSFLRLAFARRIALIGIFRRLLHCATLCLLTNQCSRWFSIARDSRKQHHERVFYGGFRWIFTLDYEYRIHYPAAFFNHCVTQRSGCYLSLPTPTRIPQKLFGMGNYLVFTAIITFLN